MQKNKTLKGLLAVSAFAAMFATVGVHAQTSTSAAQTGTSSTGQTNMSGKTMKDGTVDNTNSTGMENRGGAAGMTGHSAGMSSTGASGAAGESASGTKLSSGDEKALKDMAQADINEVAAGKIALTKAQSAEVKAYAQQMVDDHGAALTKVQGVAQQKGVTLPTEPDAKHKAMAAKLEKLSGDAFDKSYMENGGTKDHSMVLKKLQADAKKIKDADVKALADAHTPVVEQHLKSAQQMPMAKSGTTSGK